jgi:capsid protein
MGTNLDAGGQLHRRAFDEALDSQATIAGECFAIRCWITDRQNGTTNTCWRLIRRDRVQNPPGESDNKRIFQGIRLDKNGAPDGIWIAPPTRIRDGYPANSDRGDKNGWTFIRWYDEEGLPCVIHRFGEHPPGSYRGISMFAVNLPLAKQIKNMLEAYVVAKRIQACHPIFIKCSDPVAAAKKDRNGSVWGPNTVLEPGKTYYLGEDAEVTMPTFSFQGGDLREFLDTNYRNQFAAWGMPVDVVLAQLGETNMAASRSAWLQYYRQGERWQTDHIQQVSSQMDICIIAEGMAMGRISAPAGVTPRDLATGRYLRPPRAMPDPLKEAQAVKEWRDLDRDLTGLFADSGIDYRDSITQRNEDEAWKAEYSAKTNMARDKAFISRASNADEAASASKAKNLEWPIVIAASSAPEDPAKWITALAKSEGVPIAHEGS